MEHLVIVFMSLLSQVCREMLRKRNSLWIRIRLIGTYGIVCANSQSCFEAFPDVLFEQGNELLLTLLARPITLSVDLKALKTIVVKSLRSLNVCRNMLVKNGFQH